MARRIGNANKLQVRPGMSLLEVIVSTAIFFLSLVAIYGLLEVSQRSGVRARQRGQSLRICQARLAELVAGVIPLESSDGTDEQATDYQWQITVEPDGDSSGSLMKATAIAFHKNDPRRPDTDCSGSAVCRKSHGRCTQRWNSNRRTRKYRYRRPIRQCEWWIIGNSGRFRFNRCGGWCIFGGKIWF